MDEKPETRPMGQVIQIDEARIRDHLGEMVRGTVEEALNAMLDAEADRLCGAGRYERSEARKDTRAGSYERSLETRAGQVSLKVPKLRRQTFETAIIERYRRRESSVEEALIEMYLAGVSVRRVEDITEALWGTRVSPSTVSNLNRKIYAKIEAWRNRPIEGEHPYVFLDGIVMKRTWAGEVRNVSLLVAIGVNAEGFREILGICEGVKEDKSGWSAFLRHLVDRGLKGVELITSDACRGLVESVAEYLPDARWQRCVVHFYRNVFSHVPASKVREVSHMLKAIHAQETRATAEAKASAAVGRTPPPAYGARGGARRRARPRDPDLLRLPGLPLDQDPHQQSARAHHARDPATNPRGRRLPRWAVLPEPRRGQAPAHRRHPLVDPQIHEHGAAPRGEERSLRSRRRVSESAKESGRYPACRSRRRRSR
jgi:putative transposase